MSFVNYAVLLLLIILLAKIVSKGFKKERKMPIWLSMPLVILIAYSILGWSLYFLQPKFLYCPVKRVPYNPSDIGLNFENVTFLSRGDVKLNGWFIPAKDANVTVLFCHGNGGNMTHRLDTINILNELGLNCFIFDYRGYGNSKGKPTEEGTYLDAKAAWDWLIVNCNIQPEDIIIFGRSLGGPIAAHLAKKVHPRGLLIESTFTSYVDMGKKSYPYMPIRLFATFSYKTIKYVKKVHCPILIIHSRNDEIIPFEFGLRLYDAANEPKEFVEIFGTHNDGFLHSGETYRNGWSQWLQFLTEYKKVEKPTLRKSS
jgi:uncharacterized protein